MRNFSPITKIIILTVLFSMWSLKVQAYDDHTIRIAVLKDVKEFNIVIRGKYEIVDPRNERSLERGRALRGTKVTADREGIYFGNKLFPLHHVVIISSKDATIQSKNNHKRYRGVLEVIHQDRNTFLVVNKIDIETYIKGVLYHEVSDRWPIEAMKAQAVAARTYALYQVKNNREQPFDVTNDIYSQVYGGRSAERYRTNMAVERTKGKIMLFQGEIVPAYFHANSGGHTEDARELWEEDLSPLRGIPDKYSESTQAYVWKKNFRSKDIQEQLSNNGYQVGVIRDIKVVNRNQSGRIKNLKITARDGKTTLIAGKKFRQMIGPNRIRSNNYEVVMKGYYFDLIGKGWGHGVGLSQWGAYERAKSRFEYKEILKYYYPGVDIVNFEKGIIQ